MYTLLCHSKKISFFLTTNSSIVGKLNIKQSSFLFNFVQIRKYSTSSENNVKSEFCFSNADTHKLEILKAGKDKSGVYM